MELYQKKLHYPVPSSTLTQLQPIVLTVFISFASRGINVKNGKVEQIHYLP